MFVNKPIARCIGRHGEQRVAKAALVAAVTPFLLTTATNPHGVPVEVFDGLLITQKDRLNADLLAVVQS